jgi:hypothetical protein
VDVSRRCSSGALSEQCFPKVLKLSSELSECKPLLEGYVHPGRTVQVALMIPSVKAHGNTRLKLKFDEALSNFAFEFSLRRYTLC